MARTLLSEIKPSKNFLINADMRYWQRGGSATLTGTAKTYVADRFCVWNNGSAPTPSTAVTQSVDVPTGSVCPTSMKIQRNSGNANVSGIFMGQAIESRNMLPLAGNYMTFSFWAKKGANFSATSSNLNVYVYSGTGADEDPAANYTGQIAVVDTVATLTTSWQRFTFTGFVPDTAKELKFLVRYNATGTAGADDSFYITELVLNKGQVADPFSLFSGSSSEEFNICKRYGEQVGFGLQGRWTGASTCYLAGQFTVSKRAVPAFPSYTISGISTTPSVQEYNSSGGLVTTRVGSASTPGSLNAHTTGFSFILNGFASATGGNSAVGLTNNIAFLDAEL